jgi:hypothetical protein
LSNVLIGIIGVILFIGLALAGALILGDDFKSASSSSQAASLMSQLKQASDAGMMYKLKTGAGQLPSIETDFLVPRFLKTPAVNTTSRPMAAPSSYWYAPQFNNNLYLDGYREPGPAAKYVLAPIGPSTDAKSRDVCQSISETYGVATIQDFTGNTDPAPANEAGCAIVAAAIGGIPAWFTAYQRVSPPGQSPSVQSGYTGG